MKTVLVFLLLAVTCAYCDKESASSEEETVEELSKLLKETFNITFIDDLIKLKEKVETKCPDLEEKLDVTVDQTIECISDIELGSQTLCSLIRNNFMRCTKPTRKLVTECLPEESKDIPIIVDKIILAIVDNACNSTVEQLLELFNPCWAKKEFDELAECKDIWNIFLEHRNKLPNTGLICSILPKLKNCERAHQEASCPNPITKKAYDQFYEAIETAVEDDCHNNKV